MPPKKKPPPVRTAQPPTQPQQERAKRGRRHEDVPAAAASGSSGASASPRVRRSVFDTSGARGPTAKEGSRPRACAAPLTVNCVRRCILSVIRDKQNTKRAELYLHPPRPAPSLGRPPVSAKHDAARGSLSRSTSFNDRLFVSNSFCTRFADPPARTRTHKRKSCSSRSSAKCSTSFVPLDSKSSILHKMQSQKNVITNTLFKNNDPSSLDSDNMIIVGQEENTVEKVLLDVYLESPGIDFDKTTPCFRSQKQDVPKKTKKSKKEFCDTEKSWLEGSGLPLLSRKSLSSQKSSLSNEQFVSCESFLSNESLMSCDRVGISNDPFGWERMLLSLQLQMSAASVPPSSLTILEDIRRLFNETNSSKAHQTFQTNSEIRVLPIVDMQCQDEENSKLTNLTSNSRIELHCAREYAINTCSGCERNVNKIQETKLAHTNHSGVMKVSKASEVSANLLIKSNKHDIIADRDESNEEFKSVTNAKLSQVDHEERLHNETDQTLFGTETKHNSVDCLESNNSSESLLKSDVVELKLNQNDIVKMAYEIIDIVSKIHVSKSSHSNLLRNCENIDFSIYKVPSMGHISHSNTKNKIKNSLSSSENVSSNNNESKGYYDSSSSEYTDCESSDINIINCFRVPNELPTLLCENKQINDLLMEFIEKLEVKNNDLFSLDGTKKFPAMDELKNTLICSEQKTSNFESNEPDKINDRVTEEKKEALDNVNHVVTEDLNAHSFDEKKLDMNIEEGCIYIHTNLDLTPEPSRNKELCDKSAESETDAEKSVDVHLEPDEKDGEEEASLSDSKSTVEDFSDEQDASPGNPAHEQVCLCNDKQNVCPRHPAEVNSLTLEGTCVCKRFLDVCIQDNLPLTDNSLDPKNLKTGLEAKQNDSVDDIINPSGANSENMQFESAITIPDVPDNSSNVSRLASWNPWRATIDGEDHPGIPDFIPSPTEDASSISISPHLVSNAIDIFQTRDDVSVYGSDISVIPWVPQEIRENTSEHNIREFYWKPEGVRSFSSTLICTDTPQDLHANDTGKRSSLLAYHTPEESINSLILSTSSAIPSPESSSGGRIAKNPDAPAEVPGVGSVPGFDVSIGGTFFDVLSSVVEKSISPLKNTINELKMKVDRIESAFIASMRPDITLGMKPVSLCQGRSGPCDSNVVGASTCVPPFGIYVVQHRSNPMSNNMSSRENPGNVFAGSSQRFDGTAVPCNKCDEKFKTNRTVPSGNRVLSENGVTIDPIRLHSPFISSNDDSTNAERCSIPRTHDETQSLSQLYSGYSKYQIKPCCTCSQKTQSRQPPTYGVVDNLQVSENEKCTKCRICNPSDYMKGSKCIECCKPSDQPPNLQNAQPKEQEEQEPNTQEEQDPNRQEEQEPNRQDEQEPTEQEKEGESPDMQNEQLEEPSGLQSANEQTLETPPESTEEENTENPRNENDASTQNRKSKPCGICKTCVPLRPSFDQPPSERDLFRIPSKNPCRKCCTCPQLMQNASPDFPWQRIRKCPGCSRCPFPPPCPPPSPPKPPLSPIAQMYLDMSRAKHDWSDTSKDTKEVEDVCACPKSSCPGLSLQKDEEPVPDSEPEHEPTEEILETEPTEEIPETEPTEEIPETEPTEEIPETEPTEEIPETEPTEEIPETEPTEEIPETEPTEEIPETEPTEEIPETEPTEEIPETEAIETSVSLEPEEIPKS